MRISVCPSYSIVNVRLTFLQIFGGEDLFQLRERKAKM